ncbi:MAG: hypothetical protein COB40_05550 [Marinosulfonomonas sp.]|nr:MAG: hypothetical protein COB40_05550 [Marinosulfonomonas sp.]
MTGLMQRFTGDSDKMRFVRFVLIGLVNTLVGYLIFVVFVVVGIPAQPALAAAFVLGVLWNYWTHARFVFGRGEVSRLPVYGLVYFGIWAFNALALAGAQRAGLYPLMAQAALAPVAAVLSFFLIARVLTGRFPVFGKK